MKILNSCVQDILETGLGCNNVTFSYNFQEKMISHPTTTRDSFPRDISKYNYIVNGVMRPANVMKIHKFYPIVKGNKLTI